jgi:hypothetical protein
MPSRGLTLASLLLLAACGGRSAPGAASPAVSLPDGDYLLAVYSNGLACSILTFGQGVSPGSAVSVPVHVVAQGEGWHVGAATASSGSLEMALSPNAIGVEGAAWGTLLQPGVSVTLQHQVSGTANGPASGLIGTINGTVNYSSATGTAFCSTNLWSLTR